VTVASTLLALFILCLMTFRGVLQMHWSFARTPHYGRLIMFTALILFILIAFNPEFSQPPSRLASEF
jgi:hypothetical protein